MSLLRDLQEDIAEQRRPRTFETASDVVAMLTDSAANASLPPVISLDMYIAYREEFRSGWVLWLGTREVSDLSPGTRVQLSSMTFERRARHFFRLTLWIRAGARVDDDITEIPDGAEIFVPRVTGLRLYDNMAQGNTSRVELVVNVEDDEAPTATESQSSTSPVLPFESSPSVSETVHDAAGEEVSHDTTVPACTGDKIGRLGGTVSGASDISEATSGQSPRVDSDGEQASRGSPKPEQACHGSSKPSSIKETASADAGVAESKKEDLKQDPALGQDGSLGTPTSCRIHVVEKEGTMKGETPLAPKRAEEREVELASNEVTRPTRSTRKTKNQGKDKSAKRARVDE